METGTDIDLCDENVCMYVDTGSTMGIVYIEMSQLPGANEVLTACA